MKIFWTIFLGFMIFMTYDLITASISRIKRNVLDTDITHLSLASILWAIYNVLHFLTPQP